MSTDNKPFSPDCEHLLQQLPVVDFYVRYACSRCGGLRTFTIQELDARRPADLETELQADLGGTIGQPLTIDPAILDDGDDDTPPDLIDNADSALLAAIDAWVGTCVNDGTLTLLQARHYRRAIAERCVELGEAPGMMGRLERLDLKPGDILTIIPPYNSDALSTTLVQRTREFLDRMGYGSVMVAVYPPGTELRVVGHAAADDKPRRMSWQTNIIDDWVRRGMMTRDQAIDTLLADALITPSTAAALRQEQQPSNIPGPTP